MLIQKLNACDEFIAGDGTQLRELLDPDKQAVDLRYSLAHAALPAGQTSVLHSLTTSEVYYILNGVGEMHIDDENQFVEAPDAVYQKLGRKPRPYRTTLISTRCEDWLNIHTLIVQFLAHKV